MNHRLRHALVLALALMIAMPGLARAITVAPIGSEGLRLIVAGLDPVIATFQGTSASYSSDLYLILDGAGRPGDDGDLSNDCFLFNNHSSALGSQVNLGSFAVGTELIFRLHVRNTGYDFFTGPGVLNPDGMPHAMVQTGWRAGETLVGFEDLFDSPGSRPDYDYNDLTFSFTNTTTTAQAAEPWEIGLFLTGLAGLVLVRRAARR